VLLKYKLENTERAIENGQSREADNIGYKKLREEDKQSKTQH
jgi:hypothetical protein